MIFPLDSAARGSHLRSSIHRVGFIPRVSLLQPQCRYGLSPHMSMPGRNQQQLIQILYASHTGIYLSQSKGTPLECMGVVAHAKKSLSKLQANPPCTHESRVGQMQSHAEIWSQKVMSDQSHVMNINH